MCTLGQASSEKTKGIGGLVTLCADIGCSFIEREEMKRSGQDKGKDLSILGHPFYMEVLFHFDEFHVEICSQKVLSVCTPYLCSTIIFFVFRFDCSAGELYFSVSSRIKGFYFHHNALIQRWICLWIVTLYLLIFIKTSQSVTLASSASQMILGVEGLRPPVRHLYNELVSFLDEHVYPNEKEIMELRPEHEKWTVHPLLEQLKVIWFS